MLLALLLLAVSLLPPGNSVLLPVPSLAPVPGLQRPAPVQPGRQGELSTSYC